MYIYGINDQPYVRTEIQQMAHVLSQLYKQQKNSLAASKVCLGMCVCRETNPKSNVQQAFLFLSSPSVRISPARKPPCSLGWDGISDPFHAGVVKFPRCGPGGDGQADSLTPLLSRKSKIFSATKQAEVQRQSKHYSSYFLPTNVWL